MESIFILFLLLKLLLICTCVTPMETVGETCEQQHDGMKCADTSRHESQMYTSVHDDADVHKIAANAENVERYQYAICCCCSVGLLVNQ